MRLSRDDLRGALLSTGLTVELQVTNDYAQTPIPNRIFLAKFKTCLGLVTLLLVRISTFWNGNVYPILVLALFWKQIICFLVCQVHKWRTVLSQDVSYSRVLFVSDLGVK